MARRKTSLFNLSFLDLLTSALGAIIFLFIITPKGGQSAAKVRQAMVYFDTVQMKIHGDLHDSLLSKQAGDTLFTVLLAHKTLPQPEKPRQRLLTFNDRKEVPKPKQEAIPEKKVEKKPDKPVEKPVVAEKKTPVTTPMPSEKTTSPTPPSYKGDAPSVPCDASIEITWPSKEDNVDLFVCKGNNCVYGARKRDRNIGEWDSGKSRNRLFGNDLRTNQEAVRQFDRIIPGEYKIYAQFKTSKQKKNSLILKGLIYTKGKDNEERGEAFTKQLKLGEKRTLIGTLVLKADGSYQFAKS